MIAICILCVIIVLIIVLLPASGSKPVRPSETWRKRGAAGGVVSAMADPKPSDLVGSEHVGAGRSGRVRPTGSYSRLIALVVLAAVVAGAASSRRSV